MADELLTRDLAAAQEAFQFGDVDASRRAHSGPLCPRPEAGHAGPNARSKALVRGALDGAFMTSAVGAFCIGARLGSAATAQAAAGVAILSG